MAIDLRDPAEVLLARALVFAWNNDVSDAKEEETVMDQAHELIRQILSTRVEAVAKAIHMNGKYPPFDGSACDRCYSAARSALGLQETQP
jgi:hypothetical protein